MNSHLLCHQKKNAKFDFCVSRLRFRNNAKARFVSILCNYLFRLFAVLCSIDTMPSIRCLHSGIFSLRRRKRELGNWWVKLLMEKKSLEKIKMKKKGKKSLISGMCVCFRVINRQRSDAQCEIGSRSC